MAPEKPPISPQAAMAAAQASTIPAVEACTPLASSRISLAASTAERAARLPTDRSMPPVMITIVMPMAMMAMTAIWLAMLRRLSRLRKFGHREVVGTTTRGSPSVGKSAVRLEKTSHAPVVCVPATASSRPPDAAIFSSAARAACGSPRTTSTTSAPAAASSRVSDSAKRSSSGLARTATSTRGLPG